MSILLLVLVGAPAQAARPTIGFLTPLDEPEGLDLVVTTRDGKEIRGEITRSMSILGSLRGFTLKQEDGGKLKLKAEEVDRIYMPLNDFWRGIMFAESTTTVEEIWKADFERIFEVEELVFHSVRHPRSKRYAIYQLVNPGFDGRLEVYNLPATKEKEGSLFTIAGKSVFGDMPKAYLVIKDDAEPVKVKRRKYRRHHFPQLFSDCPEMLEKYQGEQRKFKHFAEHTFVYDQICPSQGAPATAQPAMIHSEAHSTR